VLEKALGSLLGEKVYISASGRTDAFVHAHNQVFNFKTKKTLDTKFKKKINEQLGDDIYIKSIKKVDSTFHARFSAKEKEYIYEICTNKKYQYLNDYLLIYIKPLHMKKIKAAAKLLVGTHNFLSFSISEIQDTVRTIKYIRFIRKPNFLIIKVKGTGFLRGMVRMLVGTLLDYNENKKTLADIKFLLENPKKGSSINKVRAGGLYLNKIKY
jgi:tRNA pseudouridine38-40 synthase